MSDTALDNAERLRNDLAAKINKAQDEIAGWKRDLRRIELFVEAWHALAAGKAPETDLAGGDHTQVVATVVPAKPKPAKPERRHNSTKEEVAAAARSLIEAHGEPMSRTDLYRQLTIEKGLRIEGKDPEMVLSTMLWRAGPDAGVVRLKGGGYWLKERAWPDADYHPDSPHMGNEAPPPGELDLLD
jgi:hypothetical protein